MEGTSCSVWNVVRIPLLYTSLSDSVGTGRYPKNGKIPAAFANQIWLPEASSHRICRPLQCSGVDIPLCFGGDTGKYACRRPILEIIRGDGVDTENYNLDVEAASVSKLDPYIICLPSYPELQLSAAVEESPMRLMVELYMAPS